MNLFYKISIDHVNANYISGWCFHRLNVNGVVELECYSGNDLLATVRADGFREDLKSLGVHRSGKCGFEFVIKSPQKSEPVSYTIKVKQTGSELAVIDISGNRVRYMNPLARLFDNKKTRKPNDGGLIVFMHIPKTAGTSFNTLAQQMFGKKSVRTHIELLDADKYKEIFSSYHYISGHIRFGELDTAFDSVRNDFYTILREPHAQLHSHLKWLIQTASDTNDTFFKHNNPVIYRLGEDLAGIDNFSLRNLSEMVERMESVEAAFLDNSQTRYFLDESPERVTDNDIDQALSNTAKFKLIGTTEEYDSFVKRFALINSVSIPEKRDKMNKSKSEDLFDYRDPQIREILKPLVCYDLKLYALVKKYDCAIKSLM